MNLLSATGVSHDYPHHGRVLHAIHLAIAHGETVALLGRSGCGKSTWRGCWWVWKRRSTAILLGAARR